MKKHLNYNMDLRPIDNVYVNYVWQYTYIQTVATSEKRITRRNTIHKAMCVFIFYFFIHPSRWSNTLVALLCSLLSHHQLSVTYDQILKWHLIEYPTQLVYVFVFIHNHCFLLFLFSFQNSRTFFISCNSWMGDT